MIMIIGLVPDLQKETISLATAPLASHTRYEQMIFALIFALYLILGLWLDKLFMIDGSYIVLT